jgi:hypothetical protein
MSLHQRSALFRHATASEAVAIRVVAMTMPPENRWSTACFIFTEDRQQFIWVTY